MWKVREVADKLTNVVMNYTEIESKVREATNDEAWGPTGTIKHELSQATFSYDQFPEVMGMLWKRIAENKRSPRRIYKSLLLLHHLLLSGSDRVIRACQDRMYEIRSLQDYHAAYEPGFSLNSIIGAEESTKDGEANVRVKAKEIVDLIQDEDKLREDRKKAKKNRDKYVGMGSDRLTMTSKWSGDFEDDPEYNNSKYSPPLKSKSSSSTFSEPQSSPKSQKSFSALTINDIDADFNPREEEKTEKPRQITLGKEAVASVVESTSFTDFADFKSAFSSSSTEESSSSTSAPQSLPTPTSSSAADLLGFDFQSNIPAAPLNQNTGLPPAAPAPAAAIGNFIQMQRPPVQPSFGGPSNLNFNQFQTGNPTYRFQQPGQAINPTFNPVFNHGAQSQTDANFSVFKGAFDPTNPLTPISPSKGPNHSTKPSMNSMIGLGPPTPTNIGSNNNQDDALKGTTWSGLNISLDSLNLSRKPI